MLFGTRIGRRYLKLQTPDYREDRNGHSLLIWRQIPYWTVVDTELCNLLYKLDGGRSLDHAAGNTPLPGTIRTFLQSLIKIGVIIDVRSTMKSRSKSPRYDLAINDVTINLTHKCNLECSFCYNRNLVDNADCEVSEVEVIQFFEQARQCASRNCTLTLSGGEPFLVPDKLFAVAEHSIQQGIDTCVSTNGMLINDEHARQARSMGLKVYVSLDGHTSAVNDELRGEGSFDRILAGIKSLVRNNAYTGLTLTCHEGNYKHLGNYFHLAADLGVNELRFFPLKRTHGNRDNTFRPAKMHKLVTITHDILKRHPEFATLLKQDSVTLLMNKCRYLNCPQSCGMGFTTVLLDADGWVYPCAYMNQPEFRIAEVRMQNFDFADTWKNSTALLNLRQQTSIESRHETCMDCAVLSWCGGGCCGETHAETGKFDDIHPNCEDLQKSIIESFWLLSDHPNLMQVQ